MPKWTIAIQTTIDAATPDEAADWLRAELVMKLQPGEEGSPWVAYDGGLAAPSYSVGPIIRAVATESPTPKRSKGD